MPQSQYSKPGDAQTETGITRAQLLATKGLDAATLAPWRIEDGRAPMGYPIIRWPVFNPDGTVAFYRERHRLDKSDDKDRDRFRQPYGVPVMLYGLQHLEHVGLDQVVLLVEGETDVWTLAQYGIIAFGIPGTNTFKPEWAELFGKRPVILWSEGDEAAAGLETRVTKAIPQVKVIDAPEGIKDLNEAHLKGVLSREWLTALGAQARPGRVGSETGKGYGTGDGAAWEWFSQWGKNGESADASGTGQTASPNGSQHHAADDTMFTAESLYRREYPNPSYIVDDRLTEGAHVWAGAPKIGKSWLALDLAEKVSSGGAFLGHRIAEPGDVLYLALEDNPRRLKSRLSKLLYHDSPVFGPFATADTPIDFEGIMGKIPKRLTFATEWPRLDKGGLDKIEAWVKTQPMPRLVIVDTLAKVTDAIQERQRLRR